jgi:hypothetical protein
MKKKLFRNIHYLSPYKLSLQKISTLRLATYCLIILISPPRPSFMILDGTALLVSS